MSLLGRNTDVHILIVKCTALDELPEEESNNYSYTDQFSRYMAELQISHNLLAILTKKILCIPASFASSERVFSTAGNISSPKRNRIASCPFVSLSFFKTK